jgi:hypothetical protein
MPEFRVLVPHDGYIEEISLDGGGYLLRYTDDPAKAKVFQGDDWEAFWKAEDGIVMMEKEEPVR